MPTILSPEELKARFTGAKKSLAWHDSVKLYHQLRVHADGEVPIHLIRNARPNESEAVRAYREQIYEAETQNPVERVIGVLEKIRRSPDWMLRFNADVPAIITREETLENYLKVEYPIYGSLENWLFEEALKNVAIDSNAVVIIMPKDLAINQMEYVKPVAQIYNSTKIVEYVPDDYVIVKSDEYSSLLTPELQRQRAVAIDSMIQVDGFKTSTDKPYDLLPYTVVSQVYYVVNNFTYEKWEETSEAKYQLTKQVVHGLDGLPAFQLPGKFLKRIGATVVKKTPLHPMVPHLNKAARESNDLDAGVIKHLHLKEWEINNIPCANCKGTGKTIELNGTSDCKKCEGSGITPRGPFAKLIVKPAAIGQQNTPMPPAGYVEMNPEVLNIAGKRIEDHIYKALCAVNMEHLSEAKLNQSGVAKQYDRDEVNNLIYSFAESLVYVADTSVYWMNELRYKSIIPDYKKRKTLLPMIPVPEKFDVINTSFLILEYQTAKTAGLNSTILSELQKEIASKKFYSNPDVGKLIKTIMELDPFPDKTIEEKAMMQGQNLATKEDVILSNYISDFVNQAIEEDVNFLEKSKKEKRDLLMTYVAEKVKLLSTASTIMTDMFQVPTPGPVKKEDVVAA